MQDAIARYLAHRMPDAQDVSVNDLARIHGGSSQETFRFRARWREGERWIERALILRRLPIAGTVVVARDLEFTVYAALAGTGLPVPRVYFHESNAEWLERPFFIMDLCPGTAPAVHDADPYGSHAEPIARQFWRDLGTLAALDHRLIGLEGLRNGRATTAFWSSEVDHWEAILDTNERFIEPVVRGAIRWLRCNRPAEATKPALVHGDYRSGNFLVTPDGTISAYLDWEMAHIGDPVEDIAWALNSFWSITRFLPQEEGLHLWEASSGMRVDPAALAWWQLFACVKGCGIWTTAEAAVDKRSSFEPVVIGSALRGNPIHRAEILRRLEELGAIS